MSNNSDINGKHKSNELFFFTMAMMASNMWVAFSAGQSDHSIMNVWTCMLKVFFSDLVKRDNNFFRMCGLAAICFWLQTTNFFHYAGVPGDGKAQAQVELSHGTSYFSSVRAITGSGEVLESTSDGFKVDQTPPDIFLQELGKHEFASVSACTYAYLLLDSWMGMIRFICWTF